MSLEPNPIMPELIESADDLLGMIQAYGDNTATPDGPTTGFVVIAQRDFDDIIEWICDHEVEGPNGELFLDGLFVLPISLSFLRRCGPCGKTFSLMNGGEDHIGEDLRWTDGGEDRRTWCDGWAVCPACVAEQQQELVDNPPPQPLRVRQNPDGSVSSLYQAKCSECGDTFGAGEGTLVGDVAICAMCAELLS